VMRRETGLFRSMLCAKVIAPSLNTPSPVPVFATHLASTEVENRRFGNPRKFGFSP
jgi:hypothetical protein